MPRDVVLHGALLEGTGTQMDKPLTGLQLGWASCLLTME